MPKFVRFVCVVCAENTNTSVSFYLKENIQSLEDWMDVVKYIREAQKENTES